MDSRERYTDPEVTLRAMLDGMRNGLWTALPGSVVSFDADKVTVVVQPSIAGSIVQQDGTRKAVNLPVITDIPVCFPRGGGCTLTFPIKAGDECLIVFASRAIDAWAQSGGVQPASDQRKHDLSDAFAIVGPQSQAHKISGISTDTAQLRSDDGEVFIELHPTLHRVVITTPSPGSVTVNSDLIQFNGNLGVSGNVTVGNGASGQFTTPAGQTVTVQDGIVTNIY